MKLIAQVKLQPTPEQAKALLDTMKQVNAACDYISDQAWLHRKFGRVSLQKLTYRDVRERFGLTAQVALHAIRKVADAYRKDKETKRQFRIQGSIGYDSRILAWHMDKSIVSIWTTSGRLKMPFVCGARQREMLSSLRGEADLLYRNGEFYLHQVCDITEPESCEPDGWLGIDLGIVNIATSSDGQIFSGAEIEACRQWHEGRREILQRIGTKSAKRRLRQLSGRQARFQKQTNHVISKCIIGIAKDTARGIAVENLTGIRTRVTVKKQQRARHSNWSFSQLRMFLAYKSQLHGVAFRLIDPRGTSKTCSRCGHCHDANRPTRDDFRCTSCGYAAPADVNAATNIATRASVIMPMVPDTAATSP